MLHGNWPYFHGEFNRGEMSRATWQSLGQVETGLCRLPLLRYCDKNDNTFSLVTYPLLEGICYWWKLHRSFNLKLFILLQTDNFIFFRHNKNLQPPAKNTIFTDSAIHTTSGYTGKSDARHCTYPALYLKLLILRSEAPSPLLTGRSHILTEMRHYMGGRVIKK